MGWLKKIGKKLKGAVKKVARTVKKVAKKVAYALPGGKQLWDLGTKIGKGAKKLVMKGMKKLGPIGVAAIGAVLSATGVGAGIAAAMGSMWASMGAVAASAASAGGVMGALGSVGSAVFTSVNWAGATLGAVGNALAGGAKALVGGNFSAAATTFGTNMASALTGEAGMASVRAGAANALAANVAKQAGTGFLQQAANASSNALATSGGTLANLGETTAEVPLQSAGVPAFDPLSVNPNAVVAGPQSQVSAFSVEKAAAANTPWYSKAADAALDAGKEFAQEQGKSLIKKAASSLLGSKMNTTQPAAGYQPTENLYEDYIGPQGGTFAGPTQSQSLQAAKVEGGAQQVRSYYNPNAYA